MAGASLCTLERGDDEAMKRGLASPCVHSALAMTRRLRLQLSRVLQSKSLKRRAACPMLSALALAAASSASIMATSRALRASPNT